MGVMMHVTRKGLRWTTRCIPSPQGTNALALFGRLSTTDSVEAMLNRNNKSGGVSNPLTAVAWTHRQDHLVPHTIRRAVEVVVQ